MAEVNMPRLSDTMQEGTISRWLKKPGDEVKRGDVIAEVETDKANMEVEAYDAGVLEEILVKEGETAPIGQVIALIGTGKAQARAATAATHSQKTSTSAVAAQNGQTASTNVSASQTSSAPPVPVAQVNGTAQEASKEAPFVKVSPLARRMAEEHGIDLQQLKGTGPAGRIVRDDIEDFIAQRSTVSTALATSAETVSATSTPATQSAGVSVTAPTGVPEALTRDSEAEVVNLTSMQKTIARRLTESKQTVPHFYIGSEIDMTDALALRQQLNTSFASEGIKISVNDLIVKACALALEKFPEVNGSYRDGQFLLHKQVHVGIAVDIPSGLVVPVLRDANIKGLRTIAREARELVSKAQAGKLTTSDLTGGTFSISNLGMMDVSDFVAVINPPQAAILAVAATRKTFVPVDDQPVIREIMHVTLSADHRILYGATVARFLQEVKRVLQNPYLLLG